MWGKEKRLGRLRALIADIEHPVGTFRAVTVHLDAHCSRAHRRRQMQIILDHLDTLPRLPTLIGGDWNTTDIQLAKLDASDTRLLAARDDGRQERREKSFPASGSVF